MSEQDFLYILGCLVQNAQYKEVWGLGGLEQSSICNLSSGECCIRQGGIQYIRLTGI